MLPWKAIGISLPWAAISLPEYFYKTKRTSTVFPWKAICICLPLAGISLSPLCPGPQEKKKKSDEWSRVFLTQAAKTEISGSVLM